MKLYNKGTNRLSHTLIEETKLGDNVIKRPKVYVLGAGEIKDIPEEIAKIWLCFDKVEKYADPKDLEKLKEENAALKAKKVKKEEII